MMKSSLLDPLPKNQYSYKNTDFRKSVRLRTFEHSHKYFIYVSPLQTTVIYNIAQNLLSGLP